ncbi:hypothetical protein [Brevundimonas sp. SH203]|uniref:hypothetical protein n=1 Tax=Brevundimonas sp. SH203 TaxID=345167 RepID=UPI001178B396|nr:hypothetical protein [Brevundimonas sp. SH203]
MLEALFSRLWPLFFAAVCASAAVSGITMIAAFAASVAGLKQGVPTAAMDGLIALAIVLHLAPMVLGAFLLGSSCVGVPTYLILRRMGRTGPWALATAGALLAGLTASLALGALGPLVILPVTAAGAVGALICQIVAEQLPMPLPPRPPARPS